ncbi:MAG: PD40 domain-containing protein [Sandaracinus sp.]|nr:PD40 domain-containing protein [Sandaracinus sp.]MCB9623211.1 PD40 domain-containing protein [Sandaracinus sp.]MCB9633695.1 PD40 domain-containing protein [Sandaracinus sp.]
MSWWPDVRPWIDAPPDTHENTRFERVAWAGGQLLVELSSPKGPQLLAFSLEHGGVERRWPLSLGVAVHDGHTLRAGRPSSVDGRHSYPLVLHEALPVARIVGELGRVPYCYDLASSADGRLVAVGGFQALELWTLAPDQLRFRVEVPRGIVDRVAISPDGRYVAARSRTDVSLWDAETGALVARTDRLTGPSCDVRFSPDGRWLASGWDSERTGLWSVPDLHPRSVTTEGFQRALAWSEDGRWLAIGGQGPGIRLVPIESDVEPSVLSTSGVVSALALAPGSRRLAAAVEQRVFFWSAGERHVLSPRELEPAKCQALEPAVLRGAMALPLTRAELERRLTEIPWFANVARPSSWDETCERLGGWDDWPGIESSEVIASHDDERKSFDAIVRVVRTLAVPEVLERAEHARVQALAAMPTSMGDDDDVYAPTEVCRSQAAFVMATIAGFLELGWTVPADLEARWAWYAAGHWPCGYARGEPPCRLLVL